MEKAKFLLVQIVQRLGCLQHTAFVVDDNFPVLSTPLASDILKLSRTIYLMLCPTASILSRMSSHVAKFPVPESANQATSYPCRLERRPTGPSGTTGRSRVPHEIGNLLNSWS